MAFRRSGVRFPSAPPWPADKLLISLAIYAFYSRDARYRCSPPPFQPPIWRRAKGRAIPWPKSGVLFPKRKSPDARPQRAEAS
jgi:hypothetical protein